MEHDPSHRFPHPARATGEAPRGLRPPHASPSPVPAGPRAPWRWQERTVEKRMRRGEGTPSEPNPPLTQAPLPVQTPVRPHRPSGTAQTQAQAHHQAGTLQAGQAEHKEPLEQRHVPVRDGKPLSPPGLHSVLEPPPSPPHPPPTPALPAWQILRLSRPGTPSYRRHTPTQAAVLILAWDVPLNCS